VTGLIGANTTLLIDFFKGEEHAVKFMREHSTVLVISELVIYEFLCGNLTQKEEHIFLGAMQSFPSVTVDREVATAASKLFRNGKKKGKPVGHQDALIAGSYLAAGVTEIVTRNVQHFSNIPDVKIHTYT